MKKLHPPGVLLLLFIVGILSQPLRAQYLEAGDAVATCFGAKSTDFVVGTIEVQNANAQTLNVNWASVVMNHHTSWTTANLGNVFGIALDKSGNIYLTATFLYEKQQFTTAGSGAVFKIDGATGSISTFATLPNSADSKGFRSGLGNICYDPDHNQFFVTNLENGKIYRLSSSGAVVDSLDPFKADNGTAGMAPRGERLWGIGYRKTPSDNGRIYFSLWQEDRAVPNPNVANEIHSIALDAAGKFTGSTREDFKLPAWNGKDYSNPVADIEFSSGGKMLLGERTVGEDNISSHNAHESRVLEYTLSGATWTPSSVTKFNIGCLGVQTNSTGGVDWGYKTFNSNDRRTIDCDSTIWAMSDMIHGSNNYCNPGHNDWIYGLQRLPATGGGVATSVLIDLDGSTTTLAKNMLGDVDIHKNCVPPPSCGQVSLSAVQDLTQGAGLCCWRITPTNNYKANYWYSIDATSLTNGVTISKVEAPAGWYGYLTPTGATWKAPSTHIPLGVGSALKFCLNVGAAVTQQVKFTWRGEDGGTCDTTMTFTCNGTANPGCVSMPTFNIACDRYPDNDERVYALTYTFKNNSSFVINNGEVFASSPGGGAVVTPVYWGPTNVNIGATSGTITKKIWVKSSVTSICLRFLFYDATKQISCRFDTCLTLPQCLNCCPSVISFTNTKLAAGILDGQGVLKTNVTVSPPLLRRFSATIVNATHRVWCPGKPTGPEAPIYATILPGSTFSPNLPPPPFTTTTSEAIWGTVPAGVAITNVPLSLKLKLPPIPPAKCWDTIKFCVRYQYTDQACRTCDTLICYTMKRQGEIVSTCCEDKPRRLGTEGDGDDDDKGRTGSGRTILGAETIGTQLATITMTSPTNGTLNVNLPPQPAGSGVDEAITITEFDIQPIVGVDIALLQDQTNGTTATIADRVATIATSLQHGQQRNYTLVFTNPLNIRAFANYLTIRYRHNTDAEGTIYEATALVRARTPTGKGGDVLTDAVVALDNVRSYALRFVSGGNIDAKICRVVITVSEVSGDDIIAVGPGLDHLTAPMLSYTKAAGGQVLLVEPPAESEATVAPLEPGTTISPVYVTVCGGADNAATFNFKTYNDLGEEISSGTYTAANPLAPNQSDVDDPARPGVISMIDCIPNPLTNMATFRFAITSYEPKVTLVLTDALGNEVATVVDAAMEEGDHEVAFDASKLPSGTYFYTLRTGTFTQTRRMQIVR